MTTEERQKLLSNLIIKKIEGKPGWSISAEEAIRRELNEVIVNWMEAARKDMTGPPEIIYHLKELNETLMTKRVNESPDLPREDPDANLFKDPV